MRNAIRSVLFFLPLAAPAAFGDIISGVVTDACDGSPMANVKVSTDPGHVTFTAANGTYSINTGAVSVMPSGFPRGIRWDEAAGAFQWDAGLGDLSIVVWDVNGNLTERFDKRGASETTNGYRFRHTAGIHLVSVRTDRNTYSFRMLQVGALTLAMGKDAPRSASAAALTKASAALNDVTYEMTNYTSQTIQVNGSQSNANAQLTTVAVPTLNNTVVQLDFTKSSGTFTARNLAANQVFVKSGSLSQTGGCVKYLDNVGESNFTGGRALEVVFTDGNKDRILLFPGSAFAYFKKWIGNKTGADRALDLVAQVNATLGLPVPQASLKAAGTSAALTSVTGQAGSYDFLAIADPATRNGVVSGWVTTHVSIGIVFSGASGTDATVRGESQFGTLRVKPGQTREGDMFQLGYFDDARLGLEAHADDIAKAYAIRLKPNQVVFCTWQSVGGEGTQAQMATVSQWLDNNLVNFGFNTVQIDDGWQVSHRNFTSAGGGSYPAGMAATANTIKGHRLTAGLWFMPFSNDDAAPALSASWRLKDDAGGFETSSWAGYDLDVTLPAVQTYIRTITNQIYTTWGYRYFKVDGMFTGMGAHQNYINDAYKPDDFFFAAQYSDPYVTNVEAYRNAWKIIRETAPDAFIMGCTVSQNMRSMSGSFGIMDALRIGPDGQDNWAGIVDRGLVRAGRRYFYNGRVTWLDPDPVYAHDSFSQMMCGWNAVTGFMMTPAESFGIDALTAPQVNLLKRTMPFHGSINVRPADFFDRNNPNIWLLTDDSKTPRRDVIGIFNMDETNALVQNYPMAKLGLSGTQQYVGFDFWANAFVTPFSANFNIAVPAQGSRIVAVRPVSGNPMVISTSRHVSSGIYDLVSETWNAGTRTLSGTSKVVGNDPYELRIYAANGAGGNWTAASATASGGVTVDPIAQTGAQVRVTLHASANQNVNWSVVFN